MQLEQVRKAVHETPKGANIVVEWLRACKVKKSCQDAITKSVRMVGRIGIEYDAIKDVQAGRENGTLPAENAGLPWGQWSEYPWLIEHKGSYYLRLYNGTSEKVKTDVHFFRNGVECAKQDLMDDLLASEKDEDHGATFTCKVENMTRIHAEAEWIMLVVGNVAGEKVTMAQPVPAKVLATIQ